MWGKVNSYFSQREKIIKNMESQCSVLIMEGKNKGKRCTRKSNEDGVCLKHKVAERCKYIHPYGLHEGEQCEKAQKENGYCNIHKEYENGQCQAIIEQGASKGKQCVRPASSIENKFCGKHQSAKLRTDIVLEHKYKCYRYRCNNAVESERSYCEECSKTDTTKVFCQAIILQGPRAGLRCTSEASEEKKYCGKHEEREYLREYAKTIGMKLCGHGMRCTNMIPLAGGVLCESCTTERRSNEMERYYKRAVDSTCCIDCGKKDCAFAVNKNGTQSRFCIDCYEKLRGVEDERDRRVGVDAFKNPTLYYKRYKDDAEGRSYTFELSYDQFIELIAKPCTYCGKYKDCEYNGIDRIDNAVGYTIENCNPCCKMCNYMKSNHTLEEFINHAKAIHSFTKTGIVLEERLKWSGSNIAYYNTYKNHCADRRGLAFELTEEEFKEMRTKPCYLCGSDEKNNGIDRIDSKKGYTTENSKPCCVWCNRFKNVFDHIEFVNQCELIVLNQTNILAPKL